ncbi:MAG: hypothetical protein JWQ07_88 [Ramlibacter sp.]|nr:hypothetical protein [Ramlibacter sp.]
MYCKFSARCRRWSATLVLQSACGLLIAIAPVASRGQLLDCPPPEQPALSNALNRMVGAKHADDAMQCIKRIAEQESEVDGGSYPDEIKYHLAKQASVAIEDLRQGGGEFRPYNRLAAALWRAYLDKAPTPVDKTRLLTGITNLLNYARFAEFEEFVPTIVGAMSRGRAWLAPTHADQFFTTLNRCPKWLDTTKSESKLCHPPCPSMGRTVLSSLSSEFGSADWSGTEGIKRLFANSKALETRLICSQ